MIAKITRGGSVKGLANYLHGPGRANEHVYDHVPGGRVIGGTLGAEGASDGSRWAADMAAVMGQRPEVDKPVWHMSLRLPAKDRTLTDAEWRDVAQEMGERMGWAGNPWVMVRHGQDHVHVVVSRVGWDGELWHGRNDFREAQKARGPIEHRLGLSQTVTRARGEVALSRGEYAQALRTAEMPAREVLQVKVRAAVEASSGLGRDTFEKVLGDQGVAYRANVASTGRVSGYSFAVPAEGKQADEWVWFKASQLHKDLAWSKMQTRLDAPLPEPKIVEPEKKFLETRNRHQERIEAARNQARAKDAARRRAAAPTTARDKASKDSAHRAMQWRRKHAATERTAYPSRRAELARLKKIRETTMAGRPDFTASQLRRALRAQEAREQRHEGHYYRSPEPPRNNRSHGISR